MIRQVEDLRPKYAALLREMAERVESSQKQPEGMFLTIFLVGGELVRAKYLEDGFNLMFALGSFEVVKNEIATQILMGQKKVD